MNSHHFVGGVTHLACAQRPQAAPRSLHAHAPLLPTFRIPEPPRPSQATGKSETPTNLSERYHIVVVVAACVHQLRSTSTTITTAGSKTPGLDWHIFQSFDRRVDLCAFLVVTRRASPLSE